MARRALGPCELAVRAALAAADEPPGPILVACSGGPDSLALAVVAGRQLPGRVHAVVVDHRLQAGSDQVAREAGERLAPFGVPTEIVAVTVTGPGGPEAAARDARYAALGERADVLGAPVWLGHTRDDQAEQVLLGLARGSGARSLAGMPAARGPFRRPLLDVPRATVRGVLGELDVPAWADPHNVDPRFARSRVRASVLPELERSLGPGVADALARTATLLRDDADLLDGLADAAYARLVTPVGAGPQPADTDQPVGDVTTAALERIGALDRIELADLPPALARRVLLRFLRESGASDVAYHHVVAVLALRPGGTAHLPGLHVRRDGARLLATRPGVLGAHS